MKTVLVTAIGSFSAPAVIRGLKEAGYRVIGTDYNPKEYLANSAAVDRFERVPGYREGEALLIRIGELIREEEISGILPLTDAELDLFDRNLEALKPAVLWASPSDAVRLARDKAASEVKIREAGILPEGVFLIPTVKLSELNVHDPSAETFARSAEAWLGKCKEAGCRENGCKEDGHKEGSREEEAAGPGTFPACILKPYNGRSSEGLFRIRSREELLGALTKILREGTSGNYLLQPMISGRVVAVDVVRDRSSHVLSLPREEHVRTANGAGLSVLVYRDRVLEEAVKRIADLFGILGCVNMEFIHTEEGTYYFMEVNPRFAGGTGFSVTAGFDVVGHHIAVFGGTGSGGARVLPEENPAKDCWIARKYVEVVTNSGKYGKLK